MTANMKRRDFITLVGGAAAAWPLAARAQPDRVRRIGFLTTLSESDSEVKGWLTAFQAEMQMLGWTLGRNLSIEYRWPGSNPERLRSSAAELVKMAPDLIFVAATPALAALHRESQSLPIVFVQVSDPVKLGFVGSLTRPGGNITGLAPSNIRSAANGSNYSKIRRQAGLEWLSFSIRTILHRSHTCKESRPQRRHSGCS